MVSQSKETLVYKIVRTEESLTQENGKEGQDGEIISRQN